MELYETSESDHNNMNKSNGNNDREENSVSRSNILGKHGAMTDDDLLQCSHVDLVDNELELCVGNIVHSPLENKPKIRKHVEKASHKVIKLSNCDDTSFDSKIDLDCSALKINVTESSDQIHEKSVSLFINDCAQLTTDDTASENTSKETDVLPESTVLANENECVPSTSDSDKFSEKKSPLDSSKSSETEVNSRNLNFEIEGTPTPEFSDSFQDTSSCDSSSSSSNFINMFSDEEDEDDNFDLVSHDVNSEDEQNSETEDDELPPVLGKTLPADKFSFPKEILLRQVNSGGGKRRHSNFERKVYGSRRMVQRLELFKSLKKHHGCVNTLSFNDSGNILISASDDRHVSLWNWAENKNLLHFNSGHVANVFQAKFLPYSNDRTLITCGEDNQVRKCVLDECGLNSTTSLTKHDKAVHKLAMQPQMPNSFLTAGEDGVVYSIDSRESDTFCTKLLKVHGHRRNPMATICLYSIHCNPMKNFEFIVGGSCEKIRLYDQRNISSKRQNPVKEFRVGWDLLDQEKRMLTTVTCAVYNHNGTEILVSYNDNDVFLFNCNEPSRYAFRYDGHRNVTTIKGVNFFGPNSEFVVSGSDCGYIYIWDKKSESVVQWMKGDKDIVNCLEPHPSFPVLATSGLDSDVKIWLPLSKGCENITSKKDFQKVVKKNLYYKRNNTVSRINNYFFLFTARRA